MPFVTRLLYIFRTRQGYGGQLFVSRSPTLSDILREAPMLMELLLPESLTALAGCCNQLRQCINSLTVNFDVETSSHISGVAKGDWPVLSLIALHD